MVITHAWFESLLIFGGFVPNKVIEFYMFKTTNGGMFSFITGKVLGVFMNFFAFYVLHFDKCNGIFFVLKFKNWNLCLKYLFYTNLLFFHSSVYKQKLFSVTKLPNLINKNTKQYRKPLQGTWSIGHCFSFLIIWFVQFKKTLKVRACLSFF